MSSTMIDQPQLEESLKVPDKNSDNKNLKVRTAEENDSEKPQSLKVTPNPAIDMDCMSKIELHLRDIRKSPMKARLLLLFLDNLLSGDSDGQKPVSSTVTANSNVRMYRNSLPQMACLTGIPRRRPVAGNPYPQNQNARRTSGNKSQLTSPSEQIILLGSDNGFHPGLKKFDVDQIKPARSKPWSLDVEIALRDLIGLKNAAKLEDPGQSTSGWEAEYQAFRQCSLSSEKYVYIWAHVHQYKAPNGSYKKEFISLYGATVKGRLDLLALDEGDSNSPRLWRKLLEQLESNDLANPSLFIGSSNLPLWDIIADLYPRARWQFTWDALTSKILSSAADEHRDELEYMLGMMENARGEREAREWAEKLKQKYGSIYPHAIVEIMKGQDRLFTFFGYPSGHRDVLKNEQIISRLFPADDIIASVFKYEPFRENSLYLILSYLWRKQGNAGRITGRRDLKKVLKGKYPVQAMESRSDLKFVEKELKTTEKHRPNPVARKINNDHSGALIQPEKKTAEAGQTKPDKKAGKKSGEKKKFSKLVLKRKAEEPVSTDPRADEIRQLLQNRIKDNGSPKSRNQQLLDDLNRLPELEREKQNQNPKNINDDNRLSAMEREILAAKR